MSFSLTVNGHAYNDSDYNASTNAYGLGAGGFRILLGTTGAFLTDLLTDLGQTLQMSAADSVSIGTGSKTFTPTTVRAVVAGMPINVVHDATNSMYGTVASVSATQVVVTVTQATGSGTYTSWTLQPTSPQLSAPATGPSYLADGGTLNTGATATVNNRYLVDDTGGGFTITLPAAPAAKDTIVFTKLGTNLMTLGLNSLKWRGQTTFSPTIRTPGVYTLVYQSAGQGWNFDRALTEFASQNTGFTAIGNAEFPVDCTGGGFTVTLPAADGTKGTIKLRKFGTGAMTLSGTINGSSSGTVVSDEGVIELNDSGASRGFI